jgi:hypothetical protein
LGESLAPGHYDNTMTVSLINILAVLAAITAAPSDTGAQSAPTPAPTPTRVPFAVGENLSYEVRFGALKVGNARMQVVGVENVRGRDAWHIVFTVRGGTFFYKVDDRQESWIDRETFSSLRFVQDLNEGGRDRERTFEIYPDRQVYTENDSEERQSVENPLDDGSFLYFVRTLPLAVGETYEFERYFRPDRNPVKIRVLRRERIKVPGGTFDTIVIQPIIKGRGILSEGAEGEIWLTDDHRRMMVQLKSKLSIGTLNLYLRSFSEGQTAR